MAKEALSSSCRQFEEDLHNHWQAVGCEPEGIVVSLSKAGRLIQLQPVLKRFVVPKPMVIEYPAWADNKSKALNEVIEVFGLTELAVRSSAPGEDDVESSSAGVYESVLGVPAWDRSRLQAAVDRVFDSYFEKGLSRDQTPPLHVLVQEFVSDVSLSGVLFTREINTGAPYYVINYDDVTGRTDTVTGGDGETANKLLYVFRGAVEKLKSSRFLSLLRATQELEAELGNSSLDVEFAISQSGEPLLLQVRPMPNPVRPAIADLPLHSRLLQVEEQLSEFFSRPKNSLPGDYGLLGQMPDWNPAEIIGRNPRRLAYSLYDNLVTERAWRVGRAQMGYEQVPPIGLMHSVAGQPYIDVQLSFASFLPQGLDLDTQNKLVTEWVQRLEASPQLHDKVEFEVAITSYSFDFGTRVSQLASSLSEDEAKHFRFLHRKIALRELFQNSHSASANALMKLRRLSATPLPALAEGIRELSRLQRLCVELGTIPFAILARTGFMAKELVDSLERLEVLSVEEAQAFRSGTKTIATDLVEALQLLRAGKLDADSFNHTYGHLRPGTYDIQSPRYDQLNLLATNTAAEALNGAREPLFLSKKSRTNLESLLRSESLNVQPEKFLEICASATSAREWGKFVFSKVVSHVLESIAEYGERLGLSRDLMSHVSFEELLELPANGVKDASIAETLRVSARRNSNDQELTESIWLPALISDSRAAFVAPFQVNRPNFVGSGNVVAELVRIEAGNPPEDLAGKIVLIENADPGFDWIFTRGICGLVTKYGGKNSHMAIRCSEFKIPAAIGCGEALFSRLATASTISLNCQTGTLTGL